MRGDRMNEETKLKIINDRKRGYTLQKISSIYSVSMATVYNICKEASVSSGRASRLRVEKIKCLAEMGLSCAAISKELQLTKSCIYMHLHTLKERGELSLSIACKKKTVPTAPASLKIFNLLQSGKRPEEIVEEEGFTRSHVYSVINRYALGDRVKELQDKAKKKLLLEILKDFLEHLDIKITVKKWHLGYYPVAITLLSEFTGLDRECFYRTTLIDRVSEERKQLFLDIGILSTKDVAKKYNLTIPNIYQIKARRKRWLKMREQTISQLKEAYERLSAIISSEV